MSLSAAIQIARSALATSQVGIQVAGNNMANASNPAYTRQVATLTALPSAQSDIYRIGRGVAVAQVNRKIDEALQSRYWNGISDEFAAGQKLGVLNQLESTLNELTGFDLSSELSAFFNTWSQAGNLLDSSAAVVQSGVGLAGFMRSLRSDVNDIQQQIDDQLDATVSRADGLLDEVADLNRAITNAELTEQQANALRDQRDSIITELSELIDVSVVEDGQGNYDVLVGSIPVVLAGTNRGLDVQRQSTDDGIEVSIVVKADNTPLDVDSGSIGGLVEARDIELESVVDALDDLAGNLIFEFNRVHSSGTNKDWLTDTQSSLQLPVSDQTLALNNPNNGTLSDLPYAAENGGFAIHVRNSQTGATTVTRIDVDLDGITNAGVAGFGDDTSAEDIRAAINAIDGLTASFGPDGSLNIESEAGYEFAFADDTSGALALLGVNSFFTGTNAADIAVRSDIQSDPSKLMLGKIVDGEFVENGTALAIVDLQQSAISGLRGKTFEQSWSDTVQRVAVRTSRQLTEAQAAATVSESLAAQRASVSGVNIDEESINLLNYQRQFQGAARLVSVADELLNTLISLV